MKIETFHIEQLEASCKLALLARDMPGRTMDLAELDKPIALTQETRDQLPPMSGETRERLEDKGYPDSVLEAIGSDAEARIYEGAGLEPDVVNGTDTLIRTDIDYDKQDVMGESNLERMKKGRPPIGPDDKPVELHHIGQKPDAPLAELSFAEHHQGGNDSILHNKVKESEIDRGDFNEARKEYWKARAEQIENERAEGNT